MSTETAGIRPEDINAEQHFWNAFDHAETEISAGWIVRFCQERGAGWEPFTREQIGEFYGRKHRDGFTFNRLIEPATVSRTGRGWFAGDLDDTKEVGGGWILEDATGRLKVTEDFVRRCYASSPTQVMAEG